MSKDTFQILADEITLIRKDMDKLQRTSLDRDEAEALNTRVAEALVQFEEAALSVEEKLRARLDAWGKATAARAVEAATQGAERAVEGQVGKLHGAVSATVQNLSQAAGEARRAAWRHFGGFWVWLASIGATGALLGALAASWINGRDDAAAFGRFPSIYCTAAGGQVVEQRDGSSYCAVWIDRGR